MIVRSLKKAVYISMGLLLMIIGLLGLILPILNGTLFLVLGLIILSFEFKVIEHFLIRVSKKHPRVHDFYIRLDSFLRRILGK